MRTVVILMNALQGKSRFTGAGTDKKVNFILYLMLALLPGLARDLSFHF